MDCVYINLASQSDRREALERNFAAVASADWRLHRFEAVTAKDVVDAAIPGALRPQEKACFLSHREAIRRSLAFDGPVMIMEDDVLFGSLSCRAIDIVLKGNDEAAWDIAFTDVGIGNLGAWPDLVRMRRAFDRNRDLKLIDLAELQFSGSAAYILNARSKALLSALLDGVESFDLLYDLCLRVLAREFNVRAFAVFPFATTISDLAEQSSIQPQSEGSFNAIWSLFRKMIWLERDLDGRRGEVDALEAAYGAADLRPFAVLFQALMSDRMRL